MNPRSLILDMTRRFRSAGVPDPENDSAFLLAFLCGRNPLSLRLDTETELEIRELNRAIRHLVDSLGKDERDVFLSRYWYAASIKEIAERYDFSESKVKTMLYRTRNKLLRQLQEEGLC